MRKFFKGFSYAWKGLRYAFLTQINFRFHSCATVIVAGLGWHFTLRPEEWLWLILSICAVIVCELFNTAIEVLVDIVSPGYSARAGAVKDLASAAVLVAALFSFITALFIFIPKMT